MWILPFLAIILGVILADQISKLLILEHLYEGQLDLIPGVFRFTYVENDGMAFGWLSDHRWVFMVFSVVGIIAALAFLYCLARSGARLASVALALVSGGGIGNMIDRVRLGFVVDFIDFCAFPKLWAWVFNVADAAVCIGAALLVLYLITDTVREYKKQKAARAAQSPGQEGQNGTGDA